MRRSELIGSNLRLLQGADRDQEGRRKLREALARGEDCRILLRNYRKNGELLWNEMFLQPLRNDAGVLTHYAGFHRDAGQPAAFRGARTRGIAHVAARGPGQWCFIASVVRRTAGA